MVTKNTVLILGAGSSIPFGFPSGSYLKAMICQQLEEEGEMYKDFRNWWNTEEEIRNFVDALTHSGQYSVDAFLEHRTDYIEIGKRAMAYILLGREVDCQSRMFNVDPSFKNWYQYLFSNLTSSFPDFENNNLSILTFNYDRSLGYYLIDALKNTYNKSVLEMVEAFQSIPFVHLHGQLGPYDASGLPDKIDHQRVRVAAEEILIVHEDVEKYPSFQKAHDLLKEANRVALLGFGYNERNVERLRLGDFSAGFELYGTCFGLTKMEREIAAKLIGQTEKRMHRMGDDNQGTYDFLRSHPILT